MPSGVDSLAAFKERLLFGVQILVNCGGQGLLALQSGIVGNEPLGIGAGAGDHVLMLQDPQQLQGGAPAGLRSAQDIAFPAQLEVFLGKLEAVGSGSNGIQAPAAWVAGFERRDQQASPGRPPRPTLPRNWWSCEMPKRSASRITIRVALWTSTPTSMTVVDTSSWVWLAVNEAMVSDLSAGSCRPWRGSTRTPRRAAPG
ncbi:hypothetical protein AHiyo8_58250 [Arthrobacter sp. Hiyo8]|nr:hypothetical protein AHiyo8_58250 [Arthrobacter sp. Hiyo8]